MIWKKKKRGGSISAGRGFGLDRRRGKTMPLLIGKEKTIFRTEVRSLPTSAPHVKGEGK